MNTEAAVRLGFFAGVFIVLAIAEVLIPRRAKTQPRLKRWLANVVLVMLNPVSVRLLFPVLPIGLAAMAGERDWGCSTTSRCRLSSKSLSACSPWILRSIYSMCFITPSRSCGGFTWFITATWTLTSPQVSDFTQSKLWSRWRSN
jgi:hypothetical protein